MFPYHSFFMLYKHQNSVQNKKQILAHHTCHFHVILRHCLQYFLAEEGPLKHLSVMAILVLITGCISRTRFPNTAFMKFTFCYLHVVFFRLHFSFYLYNSDNQKSSLSFITITHKSVRMTISQKCCNEEVHFQSLTG